MHVIRCFLERLSKKLWYMTSNAHRGLKRRRQPLPSSKRLACKSIIRLRLRNRKTKPTCTDSMYRMWKKLPEMLAQAFRASSKCHMPTP